MEHTHISDTVKMVSVLHHFFIAPAAAAIFPFVLKTLFRERGAELLVSETLLLYFRFYRGRNGQQWATLELLELWVWSEDEERCEDCEVSAPINCATSSSRVSPALHCLVSCAEMPDR